MCGGSSEFRTETIWKQIGTSLVGRRGILRLKRILLKMFLFVIFGYVDLVLGCLFSNSIVLVLDYTSLYIIALPLKWP